jgi:hypothetical protein
MEEEIIIKLSMFEEATYNRLYVALSFDKRFSVFKCYSHSVDSWLTFKNKDVPKSIYNLFCKNEINSWRIDEKLLFEVLMNTSQLKQ